MNRITLFSLLTLIGANPFALFGADSPDSVNRLSFGARFGMNFKADFRNSAPANPGPPGVNIGPVAAGADHTYDDGYVLVDSSGNAGGLTWNWGYRKAGQVVGDTMQFHSAVSSVPAPSAINNVTGDPQYGVWPQGAHTGWELSVVLALAEIAGAICQSHVVPLCFV